MKHNRSITTDDTRDELYDVLQVIRDIVRLEGDLADRGALEDDPILSLNSRRCISNPNHLTVYTPHPRLKPDDHVIIFQQIGKVVPVGDIYVEVRRIVPRQIILGLDSKEFQKRSVRLGDPPVRQGSIQGDRDPFEELAKVDLRPV